jgi:hypothetical protein
MQRRFWHPCLLRSESCSRHAYSLARDECFWTDVPLQIHVRSLQNDYAAEPQARPQCHYVIQLDVQTGFSDKCLQSRISGNLPPKAPRAKAQFFLSPLRPD